MNWNIGAPTREQMRKYEALVDGIKSLGSAVVAFSGGVDSTFLLYAAREALGENVLAATASPATFPERELKAAEDFCNANCIRQVVFPSEELLVEGFAHNPKNRCYLCKRELFGKILNIQRAQNIAAVLEGSNVDDDGDYRPGLQAVAELDILSPLRKGGHPRLPHRQHERDAEDSPSATDRREAVCLFPIKSIGNIYAHELDLCIGQKRFSMVPFSRRRA